MKNELDKSSIERFSRQIILKDVGIIGQKKILSSKVLIVGAGGLGCPIADFLSRAGVGTIGVIDNDRVSLSNIHRQSLYQTSDVKKFKVKVIKDEEVVLRRKKIIDGLISEIKLNTHVTGK